MAKPFFKLNKDEEDFYSSIDSEDEEIAHPKPKISVIDIESFKGLRLKNIAKMHDIRRQRESKNSDINHKVDWSTIYSLFFCAYFNHFKQSNCTSNSQSNTPCSSPRNAKGKQKVTVPGAPLLSFNLKEIQFRIKHLIDKIPSSYNYHIDKDKEKESLKDQLKLPGAYWVDIPLSKLTNVNLVHKRDEGKFVASLSNDFYTNVLKEKKKKLLPRKRTTANLKKFTGDYANNRRNTSVAKSSNPIPSDIPTGNVTGTVLPVEKKYVESCEKESNEFRKEIFPILDNPKLFGLLFKKYSMYEEDLMNLRNNFLAYELELTKKEKEYKDSKMYYYKHFFHVNKNKEEMINARKTQPMEHREHLRIVINKAEHLIKDLQKLNL